MKNREFKAFKIAQTVVTQAQYHAVMGRSPWKNADGSLKPYVIESPNRPATYVSFYDASEFVTRLNRLDPSGRYRLPTEAEWEYAARGGESTHQACLSYFIGLPEVDSTKVISLEFKDSHQFHPEPVSKCPVMELELENPGYCANGYGLFHMMGNIRQWTADVYRESYTNAPVNGNLPYVNPWDDNGLSYRVVRGRTLSDEYRYMRIAYRWLGEKPKATNAYIGFRVVRTPK